jgi:tetratricopeptide (TPR) repeat protein
LPWADVGPGGPERRGPSCQTMADVPWSEMTGQAEDLVAKASAALSSGDFEGARRSLSSIADVSSVPDARMLLGALFFAEERFLEAQEHWEAAFQSFRDQNNFRGAAFAATSIGMLQYDALGNESASRGWLSRAERLLDRAGRCVERGYHELALVACNVRDVSALEESAAVALDLAIEFHDPDLEARALADGGLALISQGQLAKGFARLDEAMVPVSAGEIRNPMIGGTIFCALLTACERTGELRRAREWSEACRNFASTRLDDFPVMHAHCRLAYGTVLCEAGEWTEAETEMLAALGPTSTACVPKLADGAGALATLRMMQGRLDDAAELLAPHEDRFEVCEPLARLRFLQGALDSAAGVIDDALRQLVGDRLRAGRLLSLLVEVELARGDVDAASRTAERLFDYAEESDSAILSALANLSDGRVAMHRGDLTAAVSAFESARAVLAVEERPILAAMIGLELGHALADADQTEAAVDEGRSALACFVRLGAPAEAGRATALLRRLGALETPAAI